MKILVFCGDPGVPIHGPSGASAHLRQVASAFVELGHQVFVAAITPHDHRGRYGVGFDVPSVTCGRSAARRGVRGALERWDALRLARRARRVFGPVDRVWERASLHCDAGLRLARAMGAEHRLEVNSPLDRERRRAGQLGWVVRHSDCVHAVSPWMAAWAREHGARRVEHLPNASALGPVRVERAAGLVLVHHGSLRPWHGTAFFPTLLDALPEATLVAIGNGVVPEHARLLRRPWLDESDLSRALARAHVGVLPYPDDAPPWLDPLKSADFRAVGLPVIGSLHPGARSATLRVDLSDLEGWVRGVRHLAGSTLQPCGVGWPAALARRVLWE